MAVTGTCFFFSSRRRHTRCGRDWSSDVCSSDLPYKGSANALVDVLAGRVDATIETGTASFGHIRSGKLRALALSSPARHPALPELQTISETLPGVEMSSWLGLAVPSATPRVIVDRLNREIRAFLESPEVRQRLADLSGVPTPSSPEEMRAPVEREIARWKPGVGVKNIERQNLFAWKTEVCLQMLS